MYATKKNGEKNPLVLGEALPRMHALSSPSKHYCGWEKANVLPKQLPQELYCSRATRWPMKSKQNIFIPHDNFFPSSLGRAHNRKILFYDALILHTQSYINLLPTSLSSPLSSGRPAPLSLKQHENIRRNATIATPRAKRRDLSGNRFHPWRIFVDDIKNNLFNAAVSLMNHTEAAKTLRQQKSTGPFSSIGKRTGCWNPEKASN